jgi:uncharacterized protein (DUF1015 family)
MSGSTRVPLVESFASLRFADTSSLSTLIAPPYDVITPDARAELGASSPFNIVHLVLPDDPVDPYDRAAQTIAQWRWNGTLRLDEEPTVTVMRQEFTAPDGDQRIRTGIFATIAAEPYETGRVLPHQQTQSGPKEDRLNLLRATRTATESIFLFTRDSTGSLARFIMQVMKRGPDATADFENTRLTLWTVGHEAAADTLRALGRESLYIADGHHRYESAADHAAELGVDGRIVGFIVAVNDPGLVVLATHRVIAGGTAIDRREFLARLPAVTLETPEGEISGTIVWPDGVHTYVGPLEDDLPVPGGETEDPARGLVISKVERHLIQPLMKAAGPEATLSYTADPEEATSQVASSQTSTAVLVSPTLTEDVLAVSDAGGIMPSKSTFFYPKVPSGLVLWPLD